MCQALLRVQIHSLTQQYLLSNLPCARSLFVCFPMFFLFLFCWVVFFFFRVRRHRFIMPFIQRRKPRLKKFKSFAPRYKVSDNWDSDWGPVNPCIYDLNPSALYQHFQNFFEHDGYLTWQDLCIYNAENSFMKLHLYLKKGNSTLTAVSRRSK